MESICYDKQCFIGHKLDLWFRIRNICISNFWSENFSDTVDILKIAYVIMIRNSDNFDTNCSTELVCKISGRKEIVSAIKFT